MKKITKEQHPYLLMIIGGILMVAMLLLPFASAKKEYKEDLLKYKDQYIMEEIDMKNKDAVHMSMAEFFRVYLEYADQGYQKDTAMASAVIIGIYGAFAALTLLLTIRKKPKGSIAFTLLALGAFKITCFDFEDRGVLPNSMYDWGIVHWMTYVAGAAVIAGAVWMMVQKKNSANE